MKVLKFGGTSVGSAERMKKVALLVCDNHPKIVVLSAMSGVTNSLVEIASYYAKGNLTTAIELLDELKNKHLQTIQALFSTPEYQEKASMEVQHICSLIQSVFNEIFTQEQENLILAQGEILSTCLFCLYLEENKQNACMLRALDFMKIREDGEPDVAYIEHNLKEQLKKHSGHNIYITQGFICRNAYGEVANLQRGGSDYTASLVGAAIHAEEIQIWTDINGIHNNDPRYIENTTTIDKLNFDEAAELAYFGAKILHPTCILPAKMKGIPVRLLNAMQPEDKGTLISNESMQGSIKAIAAKDHIVAIKIKSERMLMAYGFLRKVFEIFELYKTPIDMITTSEVGVSLTIDQTTYLKDILENLKKYGSISIEENMVIICVVGDLHWENVGLETRVLNAMKDIPLRMVSYGGSPNNISLLVKAEHKQKALETLHQNLFIGKAQ